MDNNNELKDLKQERNFSVFVGKQIQKRCPVFKDSKEGVVSLENSDDEASYLHRYYSINVDASIYLPEKVSENLKKYCGSARIKGIFDLMVITWNKADPVVSKYDSGLFPKFDGKLILSLYGDRCKFELPIGAQVEEEEYWTWCNCHYDDSRFKDLLKLIDEEMKDTIKWAMTTIKKLVE